MDITIDIAESASKDEKYQALVKSIGYLIAEESDLIANLANISALLKTEFKFFWVGFYLVKEDELVLGPFQGPVACTRIKKGRGVCGSAWELEKSILVPDVDKFEGHIACSSDSRSEIVIPLFQNGKFSGVLDIDSDKVNDFDKTDQKHLEQIVALLK